VTRIIMIRVELVAPGPVAGAVRPNRRPLRPDRRAAARARLPRPRLSAGYYIIIVNRFFLAIFFDRHGENQIFGRTTVDRFSTP
jgi:hypothetical protein